jgi:hypothetical protein
LEPVLTRILRAVRHRKDTSFETLLVQASPVILSQILPRLFPVDRRFLAGLRLRPDTFTVIHHPGFNGAPILQAANLVTADGRGRALGECFAAANRLEAEKGCRL